MDDATANYIKQLEAENEKLRSNMEKQDATLHKLIRDNMEVKKDKEGRFFLRLRPLREMIPLVDEEVLVLVGIDAQIVTPMEFPEFPTNFGNIAMPIIRNALNQEEIEKEVEKVLEHQKQMEELRKNKEETNE